MVPVGIVSKRSNVQKTINMLFCLPKGVIASNLCLGFGFLYCFPLLLGSLSGSVAFFISLIFFFFV